MLRNIYLIGNYAHLLRMIAREQGAAGFRTPEYEAIREELERLRGEMPEGNFSFMMEGLGRFAAIAEGFGGLAKKYTGGKAGNFAASVRSHPAALTNLDMQVHGRTGMALFRGLLRGGGDMIAGAAWALAKQGAQEATAGPESDLGPTSSRDGYDAGNAVDPSSTNAGM